uniref:Uncharacterized protein n=1 Tax=Ditylenchus dipsaci TaxID=166011 RepID=A0A915DVP7_9BILA
MENWLENLPRNSPRDVQEDNCSTCHSTGKLNDTKKTSKSMVDAERQRTASKSASISEYCSDSEPSPHASTVVKRHSSTAIQPSIAKYRCTELWTAEW